MGSIPKCNKCGINLIQNDNWYPSKVIRNNYICKACDTNASAKWKRDNRERHNELNRNYRYRHGVKPMSENKQCAKYLGVHIAERVLYKTFKNVKMMPHGNPGYDFICNHGKKIDAKSSCVCKRDGKSDSWVFIINKNTIADYFLCLAFDNRDNLNPMHVWLIPGKVVNHLTGARISESTLDRWDKYAIDIEKVVECCNFLKEGL